MPRPRSSTFYLPLAPIDAPLELKAKLSVLPPSAANALLAPRNNSNHHNHQSNTGFSRSGGGATTGCPSIMTTINNSMGGYGGCSNPNMNVNVPQEDECTRLNRVLGIPTQHTHIALPNPLGSLASSTTNNNPTNPGNLTTNGLSNTTNASLGVPLAPSTTARRRHTDAPKPTFPLQMTRARPRSPLPPTPVPSHMTDTGYFSTWGNSDWKHSPSVSVPGPISQLPTTTLPESRAERVAPSIYDTPSASIPDTQPALAVAVTVTVPPTTLPVPEEATPEYSRASREDGDSNNNNGCETEMAWNATATQSVVEEDGWNTNTNMGTSIGAGMDDMNRGVGVEFAHGAADMDMFASACDVQNPVVQREVDVDRPRGSGSAYTCTPSSSSTVSASWRVPSLLPTPSCRVVPSPSLSTASPSPATAPIEVMRPVQVAKPPTLTPSRLSFVPCGMHRILACRTKTRSRFAPSPPAVSRHSSRPSTAVHTSTSSSSTTITPSSTTCTPSNTTPVVLTPKVVIRPPPSDSLHPNDTRHLLRPQFRLSFPPPPPPPPPLPTPRDAHSTPKDTHPREEARMFVDEGIPGLADAAAQQLHQEHYTSSQPTTATATATATVTVKVAPRQRFRLAPLYLPKVLRRSLGGTAWARQETLRAARAVERGEFVTTGGGGCGFGWGEFGGGAVPLDFHTGAAGVWPSAFTAADPLVAGGAWWQNDNGHGQSECGGLGGNFGSSLVWSGYEDEDMEMQDVNEEEEEDGDAKESVWDWDDEDVEPVMVHGQQRSQEVMEEDEFVREGAPEPEERPSPCGYSPQSSPSYSLQTPSTPSGQGAIGYSMVGKFGWDTTWPASPTSPVSPCSPGTSHFQSIGIPAGLDVTPIISGLPPVHRRTVRREDGAEDEEDDEEIFRYSPLKIEDDQGIHEGMDMEGDVEELDGVQVDYLDTQSMSSCSTPTATSPSFPPGPLRGVAISSSFDEGYLTSTGGSSEEQVDAEEEFYDADGDAQMEEAPSRNVTISRPPIRAPRPLSLVQHPVFHHQYRIDSSSPPPSSVFIIPPSPLTTTTFDAGSGTGSSTPTAATFPDRMEEEGDLSNVAWPTPSVEHTLSPKRSYERIVAPRPQRASRPLEQVFTASTASPVYSTSALAQSPPPPPQSPPSSSSSPRIPSASSPRWTFGSLKSALSSSMSHLVELARSRSPSPLPWLIKGSAGYTNSALSGVTAALDSHRRDGSEEELESERSTGCVTPTPAGGSHSRRSSTTTITDATSRRRAGSSSSTGHLPVLKLQVDPTGADAMVMSESPPPKRTLSTSSLSSLGSEPDSESGSSGGIFSRSPSPEPTSDTRIWDPSYTLTPRSRPISADAKAAAACGGRLSPMMIPGSWDPAEQWAEEGDLAKTW